MNAEYLISKKKSPVGIINIKLPTPTLLKTNPSLCSLHTFYGVLGESSSIVPTMFPFKAVVDFPNTLLRSVRGVKPF